MSFGEYMSTINGMLVKTIRRAAIHNPDVQAALPIASYGPTGDRQCGSPWRRRLQAELPEMFVLGDYADVEKRTWARHLAAVRDWANKAQEGGNPA